MSAEDTVHATGGGVLQGTVRDLVAETQPAGAEAVEPAGKLLLSAVQPLHRFIEALKEAAQQDVFIHKAVKLVSVDGQVPLAAVFPHIALVHRHANQMRHHFRQAMVVIAFHPDDPGTAFWIGEPADAG